MVDVNRFLKIYKSPGFSKARSVHDLMEASNLKQSTTVH